MLECKGWILYSFCGGGFWSGGIFGCLLVCGRYLWWFGHLRFFIRMSKNVDWYIAGEEINSWVDRSSLAMGLMLENPGAILEDACMLRPINDAQHINLSELDATMKVLIWHNRIGPRWCTFTLTQHVCINGWWIFLTSRKQTKAVSEILVRRRLANLLQLIEKYSLIVDIKLTSSKNLADALTRVPKRWLDILKQGSERTSWRLA